MLTLQSISHGHRHGVCLCPLGSSNCGNHGVAAVPAVFVTARSRVAAASSLRCQSHILLQLRDVGASWLIYLTELKVLKLQHCTALTDAGLLPVRVQGGMSCVFSSR